MSVFVNSMLISANTARQHAEGLSVVCVGSKYFVGEFKILAYESNAKNTRCQIPNAKKYMKPKKYSLDGNKSRKGTTMRLQLDPLTDMDVLMGRVD